VGVVVIRNFVTCNAPISGTEYEHEQTLKIYCGCANNNHVQFVADLVGTFATLQALSRFHMATTTHVADLYLTLCTLSGLEPGRVGLELPNGKMIHVSGKCGHNMVMKMHENNVI